EPDPDPDPEGEGDGVQVVVPTDPCIFNPELPECDDVTIAPKLPWHPCTFSLDPCPGEEEDDEIIINPGLIGEIDWCEITDCDAPEIQVVAPIEPPTDPVQPVYFNPDVIDPQMFDLPLGQPQHP